MNKMDVAKALKDQRQEEFEVSYDETRWRKTASRPVNTLQLFITNKCNKRCKGCFYSHNLGKEEMDLKMYKTLVGEYSKYIEKVILLGGEPTMHNDIREMILYNAGLGLRTTIYTNGYDLGRLEGLEDLAKEDKRMLDIRIGVLGLNRGEKCLAKIQKTSMPVTIVYMLRKDNLDELAPTIRYAEENFYCKEFYISTIRDISSTHNYWIDTQDTIPLKDYGRIVQEFIDSYDGRIRKIHISRRGVLSAKQSGTPQTKEARPDRCRFLNIFPDGKKTICPFDISKKDYTTQPYQFGTRRCNKNNECLLQKIVLERNQNKKID